MPPPANLVGDPGEVMAVVVVHPPDGSPDLEQVRTDRINAAGNRNAQNNM